MGKSFIALKATEDANLDVAAGLLEARLGGQVNVDRETRTFTIKNLTERQKGRVKEVTASIGWFEENTIK